MNKKTTALIITVAAVILFSIFAFVIIGFVPLEIRNVASEYGEIYGIDDDLICAVIKTESGFQKNRVSKKGACGLMQILPSTYDYVTEKYGLSGEDIFDICSNVEVGTAYLSYLYDNFKTIDEVLCAYNAGEGAVRDWLNDERYSNNGSTLFKIPFPETENYVKKVKFYYNFYKGF